MTSALKVADDSNLPGFLAVTFITSITLIVFLLLFFKLNPLSGDRSAVDEQLFFRDSKMPISMNVNAIGSAEFSVLPATFRPLRRAPAFPLKRRCLEGCCAQSARKPRRNRFA